MSNLPPVLRNLSLPVIASPMFIISTPKLVIDTGHLVAWDATLEYQIGKSTGGWVSSFLSGEGLVCHFEGQGSVWVQTRNAAEYGGTIGPMLPPRKN